MSIRNYSDLLAWQKSIDLVERIYQITRDFPREEMYGVTSQIRRAAISIPANIAEGQGRGMGTEFVRFLRISHGSLREVETHLIIAQRLGFIQEAQLSDLLSLSAEIGRLINGLIKSLRE